MCYQLTNFCAIRKLNSEQHEFEVNCILIEKEFKKLQMVA